MIIKWLRKSARVFLRSLITLLPADLARRIKSLLTIEQKRYLKRAFFPAEMKFEEEVRKTKLRMLNLGFNERGYADLKDMFDLTSNVNQQSMAAWELAMWHAGKNSSTDAQLCLEYLAVAKKKSNDRQFIGQIAIIEAESYLKLCDSVAAREILVTALNMKTNANLYLALANLTPELDDRLDWINKALALYDITPVSVEKSSCAVLDSLKTDHVSNRINNSLNNNPKVTVIMPVYNAAATVCTALDSVCRQTWGNLEIIVVDDCSSDQTPSIVEEYSRSDQRIRLIQARANRGSYTARNIALGEAQGDFITCHDADDWSHPLKIERQIIHLLRNNSVVANSSQLARAYGDLQFYRRPTRYRYITNNMSSLLFNRQQVMEKIGCWDSVRYDADADFIDRIRILFGKEAVVEIESGPLSFARQTSESLTGNKAFGYHGFYHGLRREYGESRREYYEGSANLCYEFPMIKRPFPVPEPMWLKRESKLAGRRRFDIVIASDFRLPGGTTSSNLEEIKAQKKAGLRTGLIQMARYDLDPSIKINPKIRKLLDDRLVQFLVYGEKITCDLLILRHPPVLQEKQRFLPELKAKNLHVVINQTPKRDYGPDGKYIYNIQRCEKHLWEYFEKPAIWHPNSSLLREVLEQHHKNEILKINFSEEDWINIIDLDQWHCSSRCRCGLKPRIGKHSRDQYVKWPADQEQLLAAYPDSDDFEVHILGGANTPKKILGRLPKNWHVLNFDEITPKEFLSSLDVFVYFTHPEWCESFSRSIIEAMAAGVPVITSHDYSELFNEAAIYAEPFEVKKKIDHLMADPTYYASQVGKARRYIEKEFGHHVHLARLERILGRKLM